MQEIKIRIRKESLQYRLAYVVLLLVILFFNQGFTSRSERFGAIDNISDFEDAFLKKSTMAPSVLDTIPFNEVEVPPVFEKCLEFSQYCEQRNCVDKRIDNGLKKYIDRVLKNDSDFLQGVARSHASFVIDTNGDVTLLSVKGENDKINKLIYNFLSKMKDITPGKENGAQVNVLYDRNFFIKRQKNLDGKIEDFVEITEDVGQGNLGLNNDDIIPFHFSLCSKKYTKSTFVINECISKQIQKFVIKNFNTIRTGKLVSSGTYKIFVRFTISKCGNLTDVKARGPHPEFEKEAQRIVLLLSSYVLEPATYNQKPIDQMFSLPIVFEVHN
ncbi:energy transducer TonB [Aquimarina pacifica]|uniref:energy transducer TonB n=1 Tax=Aquimarina pacifica TaxID=1296415 RepID=UPI001377B9C7|nr:energy transducer TonB [Aquimarina pacifica]